MVDMKSPAPKHVQMTEAEAIGFRETATTILVVYKNDNGEVLLDTLPGKTHSFGYNCDLFQAYKCARSNEEAAKMLRLHFTNSVQFYEFLKDLKKRELKG